MKLDKFQYVMTLAYGMAIANCIRDGEWFFVLAFSFVFYLRTKAILKNNVTITP